MKTGVRRYHRVMAATVHDLIRAAKTAAGNAQTAIEAGREVAARIAAARPTPAAAPAAPAAPGDGAAGTVK